MSDAPRVPGSGNTDDKDKDQAAPKSPFASSSKPGSTPSPFPSKPSTGNLPAGTRPLSSSSSTPPSSPFGNRPSPSSPPSSPFGGGNKPADPPKTTGTSPSPFGSGNKPNDPPKTTGTNPSPFGGGAPKPPTGGGSLFGAKKDDDKKDDDKPSTPSSPKLGAPSSPPAKTDDKKDDKPAGGGLPKLGGNLFGGGKKDDDKKDDKPAGGGLPKLGGNLFGGGKKDDDKKDDKPAGGGGLPKLGGNLFGGGKKDDDKKDDKPAGGGGLPKLGGNLFGGGAKKDDKPATPAGGAPATPKLGTSAPAAAKPDAKKDDKPAGAAGFGSVGARLGGLFNRGGADDQRKDAKAGDKPATPKLGSPATPAAKKDDKSQPAGGSIRNQLGSVGTRLGSIFGRKDAAGGDDKKALKAPQVAADAKKATGALPGKAGAPPTRLDKPARPLERASSGIEVKNRGLSLDQKLDLVGYALIISALVMIGGLIQPTQGSVTSGVANLLGQLFGLGRYVWPAFSLFIGGWLLIRRFKENPLLEIDFLRVIGFTILYLTFVTVLQFSELVQRVTPDLESLRTLSDQLARQQLGGGWAGHQIYMLLIGIVGEWGVPVVLIGLLAIGNMLTFEITMGEIALYLQGIFRWFARVGRSSSERMRIAADASAKRKAERMAQRQLEMEARRAKLLAAAPVTVGMPTSAPTPAAAALAATPDTKSLPEPTKLRGKAAAPAAEIPATNPPVEEVSATPAIPKLTTPKPLGKTSTATAEATPTLAPVPVALKTPEPVGVSAAPAVPKLSTPPPPLGKAKPTELPAEDEPTRPIEATKPVAIPTLGGNSNNGSPFAKPAASPVEVKAEAKPAEIAEASTPEPAKPSFLRPNGNTTPAPSAPAIPTLGKTATTEQVAEPANKPEEKKSFFSPFRANDKQADKNGDTKSSKPNIFAAANPFKAAEKKPDDKLGNGSNGAPDKAPETTPEPAKTGLFGSKPATSTPPSPFKAADTQNHQATSSIKVSIPSTTPDTAATPEDKIEAVPPKPASPPSPFGNRPSPFGAKPEDKKPEPEPVKAEAKPAEPEPAKASGLASPFGATPAKPPSGIFGNKPAEEKPAEPALKPEELEPAKPKGIVVENPIPLGTSTPLKTSTGVFGSKPAEPAKTDEDELDEVLPAEALEPAKPKGIVVENPIPLGTSTPLKTSTGILASKPAEPAKTDEGELDEVLPAEALEPAKPKGITVEKPAALNTPKASTGLFGSKPITETKLTADEPKDEPQDDIPAEVLEPAKPKGITVEKPAALNTPKASTGLFGAKPITDTAQTTKPADEPKKDELFEHSADDMSEPLEPAKPKGMTQTTPTVSQPSSPFGAKPSITKPPTSPFGSKPSPFGTKPEEKKPESVKAESEPKPADSAASATTVDDTVKADDKAKVVPPSPFGNKPSTAPSTPSPFGNKPTMPASTAAPSPFKAAVKAELQPSPSPASTDLAAELDQLEKDKPSVKPEVTAAPVASTPAVPVATAPISTPTVKEPETKALEAAPTPAGLPAFSRGTYGWNMPDVSGILEKGSAQQIQEDVIEERKRMIEETLDAFGAPGKIVEVNAGPVITQFGVEPGYLSSRGKQTRVKVSAIAKLDADLALALAARSIRIEAPVPGKGYVGIEVPNAKSAVVGLRDLMEAPEFQKINSRLRIALGKSVEGAPIVADLTAMPHMLIAGTTGSGKSVCVNAIIACLLVQNSPDDLKMVMVDPKRVELTGYNGIPHLVSNVVVDLERIVGVLKWVSREMDERYKKFAAAGARNIVDYNTRIGPLDPKLPYLVVVIDELADLMMLAPEETEKVLTRLAQMARATGIHLILSTQRPSVDVVTGLIKANFPARISFMVASSVDSRVILDQPGAEKLLGRGDMLYQAPDAPAPLRVQGVYVSDAEINRITQHWKLAKYDAGDGKSAPALTATTFNDSTSKPAEPVQSRRDMFGGPRPSGTTPQPSTGTRPSWEPSPDPTRTVYTSTAQREAANGDEDDMYNEAVNLFKKTGKVSVSLLQRQLRVGYTRAERLIKLMKQRGVITDADSNGDSE